MLESAQRSPDGREVQLVYAALDASGNRATAAARVVLPARVERVRLPPAPNLLRRASLP